MEKDLNKLRDRAYKIAKAHGFHEKEQSDETYLMLIITEIAEAVNADRKGHHADIETFEDWIACDHISAHSNRYITAFDKTVKDSVEDELADVAIRLLDFAGARKVRLNSKYTFRIINTRNTFCENCYQICQEITSESYSGTGECIQYMLKDIIAFSKLYHINIFKFIDIKMKYNELRPYKNGKKY